MFRFKCGTNKYSAWKILNRKMDSNDQNSGTQIKMLRVNKNDDVIDDFIDDC